jgi:2-dehydro-3-deoxyphosphooctonate aldolase (KDO 8-P synthase)
MLYDSSRFLLIAGPCSLESWEIASKVAKELAAFQTEHEDKAIVIFKGSFDKANRTSQDSNRGPGMEKGLEWFKKIKQDYGLPVLTDIHTPEQAAPVAEVCDVLQIPAFLCRQTDVLIAAGKSGKVVNIKKGQFLAPPDIEYAVAKSRASGSPETWLTERGTTFGYGNLVVDMRAIPIMGSISRPVIIDASHGVQLPGGAGGQSSGNREWIPTIAKAAIAAGADGLFLETHPDPQNAISDKDSQWPLSDFNQLAGACLDLWIFLRKQVAQK